MNMLTRILALSLFFNITLAQNKSVPMTPYDYEKAWKEVAAFESKGLPESALTVVSTIYDHAKKDANAAQLVKAVIHKLKFTDYKEEDAFVKNLNTLEAEALKASFPAKPILHTMLGEMYWQYYQQNRYRFNNRSETVNFDNDDVSTWSLEKIVQTTFLHYTASLQDVDKSKAATIELFPEVINRGNPLGRAYRPTLYDFLAHRAVQFFSGDEAAITRPAEAFSLGEEAYLSEAKTFATLSITTTDTLSMKFHALVLLQDLVRFHLNDKEPDALVDVDLQRLSFVRNHSTLSNKDEVYLRALEQLEKNVIAHPVSTRVTYAIALVYAETAQKYNPLQGDDHKLDLKKAYTICETALKRFHDSQGAIQCENLQENILQKSLAATVEAINVPGQAFRSLVKYKNFTALYYRTVKTTREEMKALRKKIEREDYYQREKKIIQFFTAKTPATKGSFTLPDDGDYQSHSLEVKLDALPDGEYMVLFSNRADFATDDNGVAYALTTISNISYVHRNSSDGGTEFFVLNRHTGEAMAGAKADVFSHVYNYKTNAYESVKLGTFTSDVHGYFKVDYLKNENRRNFYVSFTYKNDAVSTRPLGDDDYYYGGSISQYKEEPRHTQWQTFFFLDRAIYRPGQTIYFKGLVISTDGKTPTIQKNSQTTITLYDVNHQDRGRVTVTTNEFGTFSGTFNAPSSGLLGNMTLSTDDDSGQASFSVEEYKRPKFEAVFEPVKGTFRVDETVKAEGYARAYSGANIDGAKVHYRVVRVARFPFWWWCRWGYYPTSPEMEIKHGDTQTDENGKFSIDFTAIPDRTVDKSSDPTFGYTVYADVTDINGETHSTSTTIDVGYKALVVGVSIGNIDKSNADRLKQEFGIQANNLAGQPQPAKGDIKIYALQGPHKTFRQRMWAQPDRHLYTREEYYAQFPYDLFDDETNIFKWERSKAVFELAFDTEKKKSFVIENLGSWKEGEYVLEITSTDNAGQPVKEVSYFTVFSPAAKTLSTPKVHEFHPVKLRVEPGESALFSAGTSEKNLHVLYEVEYDGKLLSQEWLTLSNEQRMFSIPVREEHRGNLGVHYTFIKNNRLYAESFTVEVPYTNKMLDVSFETFRDKLQPGQQEQWKILVKGKNADKIAAEMVATLYDESLDVFRFHSWYANFYNSLYARLSWQSTNGFGNRELTSYATGWNKGNKRNANGAYFDSFNWFGFSPYNYYGRNIRIRGARSIAPGMAMSAAPMMEEEREMSKKESKLAEMDDAAPSAGMVGGTANKPGEPKSKPEPASAEKPAEDFSGVKVRSNFNETAFFFPNLRTNDKGEIVVNFTVPESLTRWKMLGFAHTQDLKSGFVTNHLVTQKDLMVVTNPPRFFRENDKMTFSVKLSSLVDQELSGQAQLEFLDALTGKPIDALMKNVNKVKPFSLKARQSSAVDWTIEIPEGLQAITYRVVAKAGNFSDGEEMVLPVVTNRMLVTESLPLPIRGKQSKEFHFDKLLNNKSTTLKHQQFTLEFTSNPAWYAIQALPYLMEYPYDCVEQTFSRFYANSIASHIANSHPRIKQVFDTWKNIQPDALLSNLEKNQELKSALLEETPWVLQAQNETQRKRNVGLLFDLNRMADEQGRALDKVAKAQTPNGGFTWFPGLPEDRYMTQHIVTGLGHLDALGVKAIREDHRTWNMATQAVGYLDRKVKEDYEELKRLARRKQITLEENHLGYLQIQYLYSRSYFKDVKVPGDVEEAFQYYRGQAKKYWLTQNLYMQGMLCLALHRYDDKTTPAAMIKSFSERALHSEEMGMYWKSDRGYYWYQAPIETQALMIEVYDEVAADIKSVEDLKVWLLKQKQTQDWKTTKATTEACYALLRRGTDLLSNSTLVEVKVNDVVVDPTKREDAKVEAGTGYFKTAWQAGEITSGMGKINVTKTTDGVAWGAAYWQYFEQLDKITPAETPLKLKKDLFLQQNSDRGLVITPLSDKTALQVGDVVKVRIELRTDRDMEYVHLKDMRAAGFEPVSTLSTYRYQDGLYYYESPRDLATNFFIGYLPKGTYVFEYDLRVSQRGDFSNGVTTIQCMYAPEFSSHSQGIRVNIK
ncbi:alpha-2-macroglobulin family protein [Chryseolinea lacunae]|uniref:Alpha-2-macroglobulin domain-containing protein n=1 Tax=Chryseolinea lacunae TaxID=2801331 RepID=A0ABS1KWS8_9BACT|nr:alpha-2-macroglobulin family protein [Chryseolinea lacunae]MBL0743921.1 hypothetical protein [Chryseolinea lacunae]